MPKGTFCAWYSFCLVIGCKGIPLVFLRYCTSKPEPPFKISPLKFCSHGCRKQNLYILTNTDTLRKTISINQAHQPKWVHTWFKKHVHFTEMSISNIAKWTMVPYYCTSHWSLQICWWYSVWVFGSRSKWQNILCLKFPRSQWEAIFFLVVSNSARWYSYLCFVWNQILRVGSVVSGMWHVLKSTSWHAW